ncbi:unnamed protein product [Notodromas monacha]|uniref:Uncharacterized protein n=1 Tax=Notodromas monacha TaxID=399045 RepID=A0A7R9BRS0_9CRUS|nr:unnamed protein product [Notodromas monacha]CAG0920135.1 unnamed protein product [Notodromas monacha]
MGIVNMSTLLLTTSCFLLISSALGFGNFLGSRESGKRNASANDAAEILQAIPDEVKPRSVLLNRIARGGLPTFKPPINKRQLKMTRAEESKMQKIKNLLDNITAEEDSAELPETQAVAVMLEKIVNRDLAGKPVSLEKIARALKKMLNKNKPVTTSRAPPSDSNLNHGRRHAKTDVPGLTLAIENLQDGQPIRLNKMPGLVNLKKDHHTMESWTPRTPPRRDLYAIPVTQIAIAANKMENLTRRKKPKRRKLKNRFSRDNKDPAVKISLENLKAVEQKLAVLEKTICS